jgi:hypothetical protein
MDRRASLKSLLIGTVAGSAALSSCANERPKLPPGVQAQEELEPYGRTEEEKKIDRELLAEKYFNGHELETLAILCDLILPATEGYHAASEAAVADFIEFMAKDIPNYKLPLRGGIMWLDSFSMDTYDKEFKLLNDTQLRSILDQIAYPDIVDPALSQGASFFTLVRNLTLSGFYTSKLGIEELGYMGNMPNVWDGVPEEVLKEHGLSYDKAWLAKCIDQKTRDTVAQWDEDGNLIA